MKTWIIASITIGIVVSLMAGVAFGWGCQTKCFVDRDGYVRCYRVCNGLS